MALDVAITWEVRNGGSDTNGGGFKTGASGTDWTVQDAAQYSVTDGVTAGTTTITSATANFGTDVVGNVIYVQGGTGTVTAGWYEITSRTNSTTIVVDRSTGLTAGTGVTLKIGGGFASPGQAGAVKVAGNDVFIKYNAAVYSLTTATSNISGGPILDSTGAADKSHSFWTGYDTTRTHINIDANRPTMQATGSINTFTMFDVTGLCVTVRNLITDGNSKTSVRGFALRAGFGGGRSINSKALNCTNSGFFIDDHGMALNCEATGCSGSAGFLVSATVSKAIFCNAHGNSTDGFYVAADGTVEHCISYGNTGNGFYDGSLVYCQFLDCIAYNNTSSGFYFTAAFARNQTAVNCIADSNGATGFNADVATESVILLNCAYRNNTTANVSTNISYNQGGILLTGSPFTNAAGNDFTPNNTAGAGAAIRALAYPQTVWPGSSTNNYLDVGGVQHLDSGGGGTTIVTSYQGVIGA